MHWLYEHNDLNTARYILGTEGKNPLVCIGINPSTAEPDNLDPTLQSVDRISKANGFDSWIMLNIYPQRSTNPDGLHLNREYVICDENKSWITKILKEYNPTIWAAWGTNITKRPYLVNCLNEIVQIANENNCKWVDYGERSIKGHPHHPLYLKKSSISSEFDINSYLVKAAIDTLFSYLKIKDLNGFSYAEFYETLITSEFIDYDYSTHLSEGPIIIDEEIRKIKNADFIFAKAMLTAIMREDHFCNGSFEKRVANGDVYQVIRKLKSTYLSSIKN